MPQLSPMLSFIMFSFILLFYFVLFCGLGKKQTFASKTNLRMANKSSFKFF